MLTRWMMVHAQVLAVVSMLCVTATVARGQNADDVVVVIGTSLLATTDAEEISEGVGDAQPAPADLREMAGQLVAGNPRLRWKYAEILVEWGFKEGTEQLAFDGTIESTHELGVVGTARPLPEDKVTTMTGERAWKSPRNGARRGIVVPVLHTDAVRGPGRTIVTVRTSSGSFSFQPVDLATGPILAPEYGFFVRAISQPTIQPVVRDVSQVLPPADLLEAKMDSPEGGDTVRGWGSEDTPCIYANAGAEPGVFLGGAIRVPARSVAVHPGPDRDVAVGWRSPLAGKVGVKAKVADGHPGGGNGVEWSIVHDTKAGRKVLLGGAIEQGGSQTIPPATHTDKMAAVAVEPGDIVLLVVGKEYTNRELYDDNAIQNLLEGIVKKSLKHAARWSAQITGRSIQRAGRLPEKLIDPCLSINGEQVPSSNGLDRQHESYEDDLFPQWLRPSTRGQPIAIIGRWGRGKTVLLLRFAEWLKRRGAAEIKSAGDVPPVAVLLKADDGLPARWLCNELALDMANRTFAGKTGGCIETLSGLYQSWTDPVRDETDKLHVPLDFYEQLALLLLRERRVSISLSELSKHIFLPDHQVMPDKNQLNAMEIVACTGDTELVEFAHPSFHDFFATRGLTGEFPLAIGGKLTSLGLEDLQLAHVELDFLQSSAYGFLDEQIRNQQPNFHDELRKALQARLEAEQLADMPWPLLRNLIEFLGLTYRGDHDEQIALMLLGIIGSPEPTLATEVRFNAARALERIHPGAPRPYFDYISDWGEFSWTDALRKAEALRSHETSPYVLRGHGREEPRPGRHSGFTPNSATPPKELWQQVSEKISELLDRLLQDDANLYVHKGYGDSPLTICCTWAWTRWFHEHQSDERRMFAEKAEQCGLPMTHENLERWVGNPIVQPGALP